MSAGAYVQNDGASGAAAEPPTVAAFSPSNISGKSLTSKQRSTIIVHRKSPLLVSTPPPVTRALAYSHPFLLPLNRLLGLLTWTSGDPWASFLLVAAFWATVLYGDVIVLWAGPVLVVTGLILGMYSRRYSPLSSTGLTGEKHGHRKHKSEGSSPQSKTLDEIVDALREFTTRCNILLEPLLEMTDFLSTQRTATSATTRPALTALLTRIIFVTPVWILLTLHPFRLITTKRVVLTVGTIILTWHSSAARVCRVILWRSASIRSICTLITGLPFSGPTSSKDSSAKSVLGAPGFSIRSLRSKGNHDHTTEASAGKHRSNSSGIRFTFILYENQRRWLGIGWTTTLFSYERAPWTDEHLNPAPSKDEFQLPEVPDGHSKWRWVPGSEWRIDGADSSPKKPGKNGKDADDVGWIYYDNKWNDGRRGQDGWGRYTRRRKWCRDAELVEITPSTETTPPPSPHAELADSVDQSESKDSLKQRKRRWFGSTESVAKTGTSAPAGRSSSFSNLGEGSFMTTREEGSGSSGKAPSISSARSAPGSKPRRTSSVDGRSSARSSLPGGKTSMTDSDRKSMTRSIREKEIEQEQDTVDQWGNRSGGPAEQGGRAWGLGDDAHMGLS